MHEENVISGNIALVKCVVPSYVADIVSVVNWVDSTSQTYNKGASKGNKDNLDKVRPSYDTTTALAKKLY